ncbi:MAG: MFS transporter [Alphaproteobacteria bacterium]|nr:MFS transporter [Alphaproteobacteria bacterium]
MVLSTKYTLGVLTAVFAVNQLDRQILSISLDAIGNEFTLSNTQLGLLSGLVFALVYALFGIPIAKLAANGNRRNIIAVSVAVWSSLTIAMAGAQNFVQLILARLGVGIGEAGAVAPAHSMISDLYPPERRISAMATFVAGSNIGILLAFLIGGIGGQMLGWRMSFVIAGVPGLVLALLLRFTVREPLREVIATPATHHRSLFIATLKTIWNDRGLRHAIAGLGLTGILTFGALAWIPTFIIRGLGLSQAQTGIFLALTIGIVGGLGIWLSGLVADRLGASKPIWRLGIVVCAILLAKPFVIAFMLVDDRATALACFVAATFVAGTYWAPTFAFLHSRVDTEMRPMATAIFLFVFNLVGVGIGPTLVGIASDTVFSGYGARALGVSLAVMQLVGIWGAWHYWQAAKTIKPDHAPDLTLSIE